MLLALTVPVVDYDEDDQKWNRWLNIMHCVSGPLTMSLLIQLESGPCKPGPYVCVQVCGCGWCGCVGGFVGVSVGVLMCVSLSVCVMCVWAGVFSGVDIRKCLYACVPIWTYTTE